MLLSRLRADSIPVHWYVIGSGSEEAYLKAEAARLGVERDLTLLGQKRIRLLDMAQCDIYVQPSNYEGHCIALTEARALQLPCVACAFSGAAEQIDNGVTGFVTGMDAADWYERLKPLVESKDLRNAIQRNLAGENHDDPSEIFTSWCKAYEIETCPLRGRVQIDLFRLAFPRLIIKR